LLDSIRENSRFNIHKFIEFILTFLLTVNEKTKKMLKKKILKIECHISEQNENNEKCSQIDYCEKIIGVNVVFTHKHQMG